MLDNFLNLIGRFHPLLVHLPIGILLLAFLFDGFSQFRKYKKLSVAVQPALFWGMVSAIAAAISGFFISQEGGYDEGILSLHQYAGITTATLSVLLFFLRKNPWVLQTERRKRKPLRFFLFIPVVILLSITGHLGGSLTHGEGFLTEFSTSSANTIDPTVKIKAVANVGDAILYQDVIQPILEAKCYGCHSSSKQKGELRLDRADLIAKGGKHGAVIEENNSDSSSLYSRLMLPIEDKHHMPPEEKSQLSSVEIDLIRLWIDEGASFEKKINTFQQVGKIDQFIRLFVEGHQQESWMPTDEVSAAKQKSLEDLRAEGILVLPMSSSNNYVSVSFINARSPKKEHFEQLLPLKEQLVSLTLSYCNFSMKDFITLKEFDHLTWLYLDHSNANDSLAQDIGSLPKLKYLNLVGTPITDQTLSRLGTMSNLRRAYLYQTNVTRNGIQNLISLLPEVRLDTGSYQLPALATDTVTYRKKIM